MKAMVAANQSPWIDGWNRLLADSPTLLSYTPRLESFRIRQPLLDGAIMARVLTQQNTSGIAKAGVMIRENLNANSGHVLLNHTPNNVMELIRRTAPDVNAVSSLSSGATLARWVQLGRSGNSSTACHSAYGFPAWTQVGTPQSASMGTAPYIGLVVCAGNNSALGQATFDHVNIATAAPVIGIAPTATATFGAPFSYSIEATNTASIYSATGLPVGLDCNADTGVISGTPGPTRSMPKPPRLSRSSGRQLSGRRRSAATRAWTPKDGAPRSNSSRGKPSRSSPTSSVARADSKSTGSTAASG